MKRLLTVNQLDKALDKLCQSVADALPENNHIAVVGIRTRGQTIADRLIERLKESNKDLTIERGVLDITFYRDDLSRLRGAPLVRATEIDFDLDDKWVLLVDDVIHTGRSIRAALDALHDFGRPKNIRLAVLIDRGDRQLPIAPDFIGKYIEAKPNQRVQVRLKENDGQEGVFIIKKTS